MSVDDEPEKTEENETGLEAELKTDDIAQQFDKNVQEVSTNHFENKPGVDDFENHKPESDPTVTSEKCEDENHDVPVNGIHATTSNESLSEISPPLFSELYVDLSAETTCSPSAEISAAKISNVAPPLYSEITTNASSEITVNVEVHENFHSDNYKLMTNGQNEVTSGTIDQSIQIPIDENVVTPSESTSCEEIKDEKIKSDAKETSQQLENDGNANETTSQQSSEPFSDPLSVLINFLYTSHIDITQKNVTALKDLALQCNMKDVISACDEFNKVLQMETGCLNSQKEKEDVAGKFRYRYSDPSMSVKMLEHFENLRSDNTLTDIKLRSHSGKLVLDSHAIILACGSSNFQCLVTSDKPEILELKEIDEDVFEPLIGFFYTGKVGVSQQSVSKLIQSADKMQLSDVVEGCAEYMESTTTIQNCIQHRNMAIDYKCEKLKVNNVNSQDLI